MKIQQHDGVVLMELQYSGRASPSVCGRERCSKGEGRRQVQGCGCPPSPLYI